MRPKKYHCKTFQQDIWFFIGWKPEDFAKYLKRNCNYRDNFDQDGGTCLALKRQSGYLIVVWVGEKGATDILTHEALHAANFILENIGHKPSHDNDEVQAYLMQEIFNEARGA